VKDLTDTQRTDIARIIDRAWPCYVHYADPASLAGNPQETIDVLKQIDAVPTNSHSEGLPIIVPSPLNITEAMVLGHEHHAGCIGLARAITRCLPALTQALTEGRLPPAGESDPHDIRAAFATVHGLHHRLDPTGEDDTALIEALCIKQANPTPIEIGSDWKYMVRLTHDHAMGGQLGAFDYMPMRCFLTLDDARNWALLQAIWDCHILEDDTAANLKDPRHQSIVAALADHDGSDRAWRLPFSNATLRFTRHHDGQ
jgi:hypothetical protein